MHKTFVQGSVRIVHVNISHLRDQVPMTHIKCLVIKQENEMAPEHKGQRKSTSCRVVRIFVVVCGETVIVI